MRTKSKLPYIRRHGGLLLGNPSTQWAVLKNGSSRTVVASTISDLIRQKMAQVKKPSASELLIKHGWLAIPTGDQVYVHISRERDITMLLMSIEGNWRLDFVWTGEFVLSSASASAHNFEQAGLIYPAPSKRDRRKGRLRRKIQKLREDLGVTI